MLINTTDIGDSGTFQEILLIPTQEQTNSSVEELGAEFAIYCIKSTEFLKYSAVSCDFEIYFLFQACSSHEKRFQSSIVVGRDSEYKFHYHATH